MKRTDSLKEIFKIAKATFKSKKCKIKNPTRAFLKIPINKTLSNYEEIFGTDKLCNEDCVVVSEGDPPDGFNPELDKITQEKLNDAPGTQGIQVVTDRGGISRT